MKLTFSFGKTNEDANLEALAQVKDFILSGEKTYVVVPDRASLITELSSLKMLGISGAFNFRVLTINKLASLVLGEENTLSSFGGNLLVKKILKEQRQNLVCFNKMASNMNFASQLYRTIQQLKASGITPLELSEKQNIPNGIKLKISDVKLIWEKYEEEIETNFSDGFSRLKSFKEKIKTSSEIKDANFIFLHNSNLTEEMISVICEIIKFAKSSIVALPVPSKFQPNSQIYDSSALDSFNQFANNIGLIVGVTQNKNTSAIKEKLLSFTLGGSKQTTEDVLLLESEDEIEEVKNCCNLILSYVNDGAKFSDFNIVLADESYEKILERSLKRNNIPHFFDRQIGISNHALSKLIESVLNCFCFDFQSEFVLELVKNYYFSFTSLQLSDFENYVYKYGVEGAMFFSPFFDEKAEQVRCVLEDVIEAYKVFKKEKNVNCLVDVMWSLLASLNVEEKTSQLSKMLEEVGDFENAKISLQIQEKIKEVFDDIVLIFKKSETTSSELRDLILNGLKLKTISLVPIKTGSVYVGDFSSSYFEANKINFVLGGNFGSFPGTMKDVGIISDEEIEFLKLKHKLEPSIKTLNRRSMFKAFEICADAKKIIISFAKQVGGETKTESLISIDLRNLFDCELQSWIINRNIISKCDAKLLENTQKEEEKVGRAKLILDKDEIAITSLERYFECPLKFTLLGQVKIKERESGLVQAFDIGNIYHEFLKALIFQIDKINDENIAKISNEIIDRVLKSEKYSTILEVQKNKLILKNIKKECVNLAKIVLIHHKQSNFKANKNLLEASFGVGEKLKAPKLSLNGENFNIKGKIDRVDTFGDQARVIDYKTGSDKFNFTDIFYGKKIQLISYLMCMEENGFDGIGAYYFPLRNSYKGKDFLPKLDGITLKDLNTVRNLDLALNAGQKSKLINIALKNDGSFSESVGKNTLLSKKEMDNLSEYVKNVMMNATAEIKDGFCEAWPIQKSGNICACDFCPFKYSYFCLNAKRRRTKTVTKQSFAKKEEE